ncbi:NAD(P)-binding protein [Delitschia confertaspora ATCC 74209]|uniref:NAD(P)-binding protein n=1 Tax=Delitschia confertaspora ATCC 74209 TaxID=1513339 RepID=A0A9P4JAK3_9PLEO|nr:NAD(P)-binding protein [Delitschia confertaspora ATCC 74209]
MSSSHGKKILTVFGATGNQGGSVINAVLNDPELSNQYTVRAITRDISNPVVQTMKAKGAEIVQADLDVPSTLPAALSNAHTLFLMTNTTYTSSTKATETRQAKAVLDLAVSLGIEYVIWSSMSHPYRISKGALQHVEHFDVKAEIETYIRTLPLKSAFFAPGSFMQNLHASMRPRPLSDGSGKYGWFNNLQPSTLMPLIDITDTGKWIAAILSSPSTYEGKFFAAAERLYSVKEIVDIMSKVTGKEIVHVRVEDEAYNGWLPEGFREELGEMMVLVRDYGYFGEGMERDVAWAREQVRGEVRGLEEFLRQEPLGLE